MTTVKKGFEIEIGDKVYKPITFGGNPSAPTNSVSCLCHEGKGCKYVKKQIHFGPKFEFCEAKNAWILDL